jgi:AcrR family transcriptional regulator
MRRRHLRYFGSKDVLVAEALIAEARDLTTPILELLASDRPGPERAAEAVLVLDEMFESRRAHVPVYLAALAAAPHTPQVREGLAGLWGELTDRVAADIARQRDDGLLPTWVQPPAMAALIVAVVNGVVVGSVLDPDRFDHRAVASQFLTLLLTSVATPPLDAP